MTDGIKGCPITEGRDCPVQREVDRLRGDMAGLRVGREDYIRLLTDMKAGGTPLKIFLIVMVTLAGAILGSYSFAYFATSKLDETLRHLSVSDAVQYKMFDQAATDRARMTQALDKIIDGQMQMNRKLDKIDGQR